jgi:aspartyl/asparaginyl beta-hydroxylase (cupin superfamily)
MSSTTYRNIQQLAIKEAISVENLLPHFVRITDVDDSPDLTDVHPRDREDMDLRFMSIDENLFPKTSALIKSYPEIRDAYIIGFAPQTQLYPHVKCLYGNVCS